MGVNDIQKAKDDLAMKTMQAYMDVVYYKGTIRMAAEKLEESNRTLYKTRRQEELGLKGKADVAQFEAQVAADDYTLTHQQNLFNTALLTLRECILIGIGRRVDRTAKTILRSDLSRCRREKRSYGGIPFRLIRI